MCHSVIKHEFVVFRKQILLIKAILAPLKLIGRVDAATWLLCVDLFALNVTLRWCTMGGGEVQKT